MVIGYIGIEFFSFPYVSCLSPDAIDFSTYRILTNQRNGLKGLILNWGQIATMSIDLIGIVIIFVQICESHDINQIPKVELGVT
jgi:hypothetical protein